jgi:MoxR-like ATPase
MHPYRHRPLNKEVIMETTEQLWEQVRNQVQRLRQEIAKAVVGQDQIVHQMLVALLCGGHCLIIGVPGLGKTLLVRTLGRMLGLKFSRIQFTPDLMPTDILGTEILQSDRDGARNFKFVIGPVFAHLLLADEINRTPPKTQAALLEAMQEKQVTVSGEARILEEPFVVFATQNPIEHEGTYPLPEAQLDRFFFSLKIDYPSLDEERLIVQQRQNGQIQEVLKREELLKIQQVVDQVPIPDHVTDFILKLVHSTRPQSPLADDYIKRYVEWGAGPRASQNLARAAKAYALLDGNTAASLQDVRQAAPPVLRHRIIPNYNATGEGLNVETIVQHLLEKV